MEFFFQTPQQKARKNNLSTDSYDLEEKRNKIHDFSFDIYGNSIKNFSSDKSENVEDKINDLEENFLENKENLDNFSKKINKKTYFFHRTNSKRTPLRDITPTVRKSLKKTKNSVSLFIFTIFINFYF